MPLFTVILGDATDMMGDASGETSYVDSMEEVALQHYSMTAPSTSSTAPPPSF